MTVDETARLHLYEQARESWDDDAATTLMNGLPMNPRELATEGFVTMSLENTEHRLKSYFDRRWVQLVFAMVGVNITMASVISIGWQLAR